MYFAIKEKFEIINQRELSKIVGLNEATLSRIINNKQGTSKRTAYCIAKAIKKKKKIEDYFYMKGE